MIVVGESDGAVRVGPAAHGEIPGGYQHEVAMEDSLTVDLPDAVHGRVIAMARAHLIEQLSNGEELAHRTDVKLIVRPIVNEFASGIGIKNAQSPDAFFVCRLVENGLDIGWNPASIRLICLRR